MFDVVWSGRRHVMMGASQIDPYGNQNFAAIGVDYTRPKVQLLGFRGAPGNTINDVTSYWVPNHSTNVFVERVDVVCGIGYDRAAELGPDAARYHEIRRVVTNLCVLDFDGQRPPHATAFGSSRCDRGRRRRRDRASSSRSPKTSTRHRCLTTTSSD